MLERIEIEFEDEYLSSVPEVKWNENGEIKCELSVWRRLNKDWKNVNFSQKKLVSEVTQEIDVWGELKDKVEGEGDWGQLIKIKIKWWGRGLKDKMVRKGIGGNW